MQATELVENGVMRVFPQKKDDDERVGRVCRLAPTRTIQHIIMAMEQPHAMKENKQPFLFGAVLTRGCHKKA